MAEHTPLPIDSLNRRCDIEQLPIETTDDLEDLDELLGQERALSAIEFAIGMGHDGYNLFALGPNGTGKHEVVRRFLEREAADHESPPDWCYVNNFDNPFEPRAMELPAGRGVGLRDDMESLIEDLKGALPGAFESDRYEARRQAIEDAFKERQQDAFKEIRKKADEKGLAIMRTPMGLILLPKKDDDVLSPEAFNELPEEERKRVEADIEELQGQLEAGLSHSPRWEKERREEVRELNREVTSFAVADLIAALVDKYAELDVITEFLEAVKEDIIENVDQFLESMSQQSSGGPGGVRSGPQGPMAALRHALKDGDALARYEVNVIVDNSEAKGGPVVYEDNPTLANLVGRVEHRSVFGTMTTDFSLIRPGALHRANSGFLMLDALKVLQQPFSWEMLKRTLRSKQLRIESPGQILSAISTITLEPEPIPLQVRVVLVGQPELYYLLSRLDPDFPQLFKVAADFDVEMDRDAVTTEKYARYVATKIREEGLRPFERDAVARVIERSSRMVADAEKLSVHIESLIDLLREADYWAGRQEQERVRRQDVQKAIDARLYQEGRIRERILEEIERGTFLIDSEGERVGQLNGLSVSQVGRIAFGRPTRITARVRLGRGNVVDIEREVELGGPIHSKGVLILSGFLGERYAREHPLALSASLVFEQSYGGIEGDSASLAELCALLSAIAEVPLRQDLAVTGSVNQMGDVQAVGGVNEKIEGFFDVCETRGLTGRQGVILPASNVVHLMLKDVVLEAATDGRFAVYTVETVDQAIELLTGLPAGEPDQDGIYPEGTVNRRVADHLKALAETASRFAHGPSSDAKK